MGNCESLADQAKEASSPFALSSRLVFCDSQREVPNLSRGWRTPDPSPTRNAVGLPRCKPVEVRFEASTSGAEDESVTPRYCESLAFLEGGLVADRTLSPPSTRAPSPRSFFEPSRQSMLDEHGVIPVIHEFDSLPQFPAVKAAAANEEAADSDPQSGPVTISAGSAGHPYNCSEPCKYLKKRRGCKDGASCDRCHLCSWKSTRVRKTAVRAARKDARND
jgi:hypothetical protein